MQPWLTIVTIVKDDQPGLERTAASLAGENLDGVEYLIIDGSAPPLHPSTVPSGSMIHEPARGVYAAMNAGLSHARGTYVWFLNAGDQVAAAGVIDRIRAALRDVIWAFGPVIVVDQRGRETPTPRWNYQREQARSFARGHFPAHQGTIASRETLLDLGGFDTSYRICADYAMALKLSQVASPSVFDFPLARFHEGGLSTTAWRESVAEFHRARREILKPTGTARIMEQADTTKQFVKLGIYRTFLDRQHV